MQQVHHKRSGKSKLASNLHAMYCGYSLLKKETTTRSKLRFGQQNAGDWFFVCVSHLPDPAFCKVVAKPVSPEIKAQVEDGKKKNETDKVDKCSKPPDESYVPFRPDPTAEYILDERIFFLRRQKVKERVQPKTVMKMPVVPKCDF